MELPRTNDEDAIVKLLQSDPVHGSPELHYQLIRALGQWGGEASVYALANQLDELSAQQPDLVGACMVSLKTIGGKVASSRLDQMTLEKSEKSRAQWYLRELETGGTIDPTEGITAGSRQVEIVEAIQNQQISPVREIWLSVIRAVEDLARLAWNAGLLQIELETEIDPDVYRSKYVHYLTVHSCGWSSYFSRWDLSRILTTTTLKWFQNSDPAIAGHARRRKALTNYWHFFFQNPKELTSLRHRTDHLADQIRQLAEIPHKRRALAEVKRQFESIAGVLNPIDSEANSTLAVWVSWLQTTNLEMLPAQMDILPSRSISASDRGDIRRAIQTLDAHLSELLKSVQDAGDRGQKWSTLKESLEALCQETLDVAQLFGQSISPHPGDFDAAVGAFRKFRQTLVECQKRAACRHSEVKEIIRHVEMREKSINRRRETVAEVKSLVRVPEDVEALVEAS